MAGFFFFFFFTCFKKNRSTFNALYPVLFAIPRNYITTQITALSLSLRKSRESRHNAKNNARVLVTMPNYEAEGHLVTIVIINGNPQAILALVRWKKKQKKN